MERNALDIKIIQTTLCPVCLAPVGFNCKSRNSVDHVKLGGATKDYYIHLSRRQEYRNQTEVEVEVERPPCPECDALTEATGGPLGLEPGQPVYQLCPRCGWDNSPADDAVEADEVADGPACSVQDHIRAGVMVEMVFRVVMPDDMAYYYDDDGEFLFKRGLH